MIERICTYDNRDDLLVAYLYDEIDAADRGAFSAHLSGCGRCTRELAALRGVRTTLSTWAPPEPRVVMNYEPRTPSGEPGATGDEGRSDDRRGRTRSWHDVPGWAQVVAALLVLGVSAGIANVEVRRDSAGWTLRTGWSKIPAQNAAPAPAAASSTPWRADLAALERQLRTEFQPMSSAARAVPAAAPTSTMSDAELQRRVRAIISESERRQESELALRVAEVVKDVNAQRQSDLLKIDRSLGIIQSSNYGEQMKQRELVNYLLKVSQKQ
jgi:anti-sigma factor RsiW